MNHFITREQAKKMTETYRREKENILNSQYQGKDILPNLETFDAAPFREVLNKPGCTSLRIYLGMNDDLKVRIIAVGVNENGEEILDGNNSIVEEGTPCPPYCPPPPPPDSLNY